MTDDHYYLTPGPPPEWPGKVAAWLKRAAASFRGPSEQNMLHPNYYSGPAEPTPEPPRARPVKVEPSVPDRETLRNIFDWPAARLAALRPLFRR